MWLTLVIATAFGAAAAASRAVLPCLCSLPLQPSPMLLAVPVAMRLDGLRAPMCNCTLATVELVNAAVVAPLLVPLLHTPYFATALLPKHEETCTLWPDEGMCSVRDCAVDEVGEEAGALLRQATENALEMDRFALVDLNKNREQHTGYEGDEPRRIWTQLYQEAEELDGKPLQHLAARLVSGMHASISSHIAFRHALNRTGADWGVDMDVYRERVNRHGPRVRNLALVYLVVLNAVHKAADIIRGMPVQTPLGAAQAPQDELQALLALLGTKASWPRLRHRTLMRLMSYTAPEDTSDVKRQRAALHRYFDATVQPLLDCVGCDRCRLWSRVQFDGVSTALDVLFASTPASISAALTRPRLVAMFNALGRFSHSLHILTTLRSLA